jgi:DHA2 family multidrug resistance protein
MQRFNVRFIAAVGFSLFAVSCFMNSHMTHDTGIDELRWSQLRTYAGTLDIAVLSWMEHSNRSGETSREYLEERSH